MVVSRSLVLLCVIAALTLGVESNKWLPGLKVRFSLNFWESAFIDMPRTKADAESNNWELMDGPDLTSEDLPSLELWCPTDDYTVCALFDDLGYVGGLQVAFPTDSFVPLYDMNKLGFSMWSTTLGGNTVEYYTTRQYFVSADTLAQSEETRLSHREELKEAIGSNDTQPLVDTDVWVKGFDGKLFNISVDTCAITAGNTIYTSQNCVLYMGKHYYYNMDENLECNENTIFPWFPLLDESECQLTGMGLMVFGNFTGEAPAKFEAPNRQAVEFIVTSGPECLYELAESPGVVTLHFYFINSPRLMFCL